MAILERSAEPLTTGTVLFVNEIGPVSPRAFLPAPGWSPGDDRIKVSWESPGMGPGTLLLVRPRSRTAIPETGMAQVSASGSVWP
jgi:hypothetical protein